MNQTDPTGEQTLDIISTAKEFNEWMYQTINPYCKGNILEIGSGIGNISQYFLRDGYSIMLTDLRTPYCGKLNSNFYNHSNLLGIKELDLTDDFIEEKFNEEKISKFDTIFALNVIEHIENDTLAIQNCYKLLKPGGTLIILVPAYQFLYNSFDKGLDHFRRYSKHTLNKLLLQNGFEITHSQHFNFVAIFGWFLSGTLLRNEVIPEKQMKLFSKLLPVVKLIDNLILNKAGISVISIGRKPE